MDHDNREEVLERIACKLAALDAEKIAVFIHALKQSGIDLERKPRS